MEEVRLTAQHDSDILWRVEMSALPKKNSNSPCSPSPVTHLATLETCTRVSTEFCKSSPTTGDFNTDFVAHKKAFVILCNTFLGRFSTVKFLKENETSSIPSQTYQDTYHKAIPNSGGSRSVRVQLHCLKDVLQFDVDNIAYFSETTLKVLLTCVFW